MSQHPRNGHTYAQLQFTVPPDATEIVLVRHGESALMGTVDYPTTDGCADPELTDAGHGQARRLGGRRDLGPLHAIYTSGMVRTAQTAAPLADRFGMQPEIDRDLREVHLGEWEGGLFRKKVLERDPLGLRVYAEERWDVIPGAESADRFAARVRRAVERIARAHRGHRVAVVTHGGVIGQALAHAASARPFTFVPCDNTGVSRLVVEAEIWTIRSFNDTAHLVAAGAGGLMDET